MARRKQTTQPNPLLASPPDRVHAGSWADREAPRLSEYQLSGVHTADEPWIAAVYAFKAAQSLGGDPVILAVDVSGLEALTDYDGMIYEQRLLELPRFELPATLDEAMDDFSDGTEWTQVPLIDAMDRRIANLLWYFETEEEYQRFVQDNVLPPDFGQRVSGQRRYLDDIEDSRILSAAFVQPVSPRYVSYDELDDEYDGVFDLVDYDFADMPSVNTSSIDDRPLPMASRGVQFHGTSSLVAEKVLNRKLPASPWRTDQTLI